MDKRAQNNPEDFLKIAGAIIGVFVTIIILVAFLNFMSNLGCEDERRQVGQLKSELSICNAQIQNQTILAQNLNNQCIERINQSISTCNDELTTNLLIVKQYRQFFLIYHISIALSFVFVFSLLKFVLKWQITTNNKKLKIFLKSIKIIWSILWILLSLVFIFIVLFCLTYLFSPHWF